MNIDEVYQRLNQAANNGERFLLSSEKAGALAMALFPLTNKAPKAFHVDLDNKYSLRECPLCGDVSKFNPTFNPVLNNKLDQTGHVVECTNCGCCSDEFPTQFEARQVWNFRPVYPRELNDLLHKILGWINSEYASEKASALDGDPLERGEVRKIRDEICEWL